MGRCEGGVGRCEGGEPRVEKARLHGTLAGRKSGAQINLNLALWEKGSHWRRQSGAGFQKDHSGGRVAMH